MKKEQTYNAKQAAKVLGLCDSSVRRYARKGQIQRTEKDTYTKESVDKLAKELKALKAKKPAKTTENKPKANRKQTDPEYLVRMKAELKELLGRMDKAHKAIVGGKLNKVEHYLLQRQFASMTGYATTLEVRIAYAMNKK